MFLRAVMYRELPVVLTMLICTVQKETQSCNNLSKNENSENVGWLVLGEFGCNWSKRD